MCSGHDNSSYDGTCVDLTLYANNASTVEINLRYPYASHRADWHVEYVDHVILTAFDQRMYSMFVSWNIGMRQMNQNTIFRCVFLQ